MLVGWGSAEDLIRLEGPRGPIAALQCLVQPPCKQRLGTAGGHEEHKRTELEAMAG